MAKLQEGLVDWGQNYRYGQVELGQNCKQIFQWSGLKSRDHLVTHMRQVIC